MIFVRKFWTFGRRFGAGLLLAWVGLGAAHGQETAGAGEASSVGESNSAAASMPTDEEILVLGQNPGALRQRIRLATDAVYAKFNELNSDDAFDVECRYRTRTGSHMRVRICESNYWRDAQADAGEEIARAMRGEGSTNPDTIYASARLKSEEMSQEVYRLMLENDEFRLALRELGALVQASRKDRPIRASTTSVLTAGYIGEGLLPYGAVTAAQVTIGRRPWKFKLSQPTFAFGALRGNIEAIAIRCRGVEEQLDYEGGAEWSLPDDWEACELRVEASPQTTFAFYEFQ